MILAIDIGNTNIVIGCCDKEKILFMERLTTDHHATALEYAIKLKAILEIHEIDKNSIQGAVISSVVPSVTDALSGSVRKLTGTDAMVVNSDIKTGLCIKTDNPSALGSDIIVDAVAGIQEYGAPLIIFDMGTATTVSVINSEKEYIGGMILPGMMISLNALVSGTSKLPKISTVKPERLIGKNTVDCMKSGIMYGTAASMDGIIDRIKEEMGDMTVVATGGLASSVVPLCRNEIILDDELLIKGLMIIYRKNI